MSGYRWLWVAWIGLFLVLEFTAIIRRRYQDTLSEFVWNIAKVTPGNSILTWTAVHVLVVGFLIWLTAHIGWGYFR